MSKTKNPSAEMLGDFTTKMEYIFITIIVLFIIIFIYSKVSFTVPREKEDRFYKPWLLDSFFKGEIPKAFIIFIFGGAFVTLFIVAACEVIFYFIKI